MNHNPRPIDEYTLAAFLAGTLPQERRLEVAAYLADNADARELLCMAHEALEAAQTPVPTSFEALEQEEAAPHAPAVPGRPMQPPAWRPRHLRRYAAAAMIAVVLGVGLRLGLDPGPGTLRGIPSADEPTLDVRVSTSALQFQWTKVEEAYYYRVVIWDPLDAQLIAQHETRARRLRRDDAFVLSLRAKLAPARLYTVRVDAVDVQNRLIQSSELVEFMLEE